MWASWADALPMLRARHPALTQAIVADLSLESGPQHANCLRELHEAKQLLEREGFATCPTWAELSDGARPEALAPDQREPGEWAHGWQFHAASQRETLLLYKI